MNLHKAFYLIAIMALLSYAGYHDYKRRVIPDRVPACLLVIGLSCTILARPESFLYIPCLYRIAGGLFPAVLLLLLGGKYGGVGGGDIKLIAASGFLFGIYNLVVILFFATCGGLIWAKIKRQRSVPMAVFMLLGALPTLALL